MTTVVSTDRTPPGPQALPWLGGREALVSFFRDPLAFLSRLQQGYGSIVAFTRQHPTWLAVCGSDATRQLLTQPEQFRIALLPFTATPSTALHRLSSGLAFMDGATHTQHRQLLQPSFRHQTVTAYANDIVMLVQDMLDRWQLGVTRDICRDMHDLSIQVGARAFFGIRSNSDAETLGMAACEWLAHASSLPVALLPLNLPGMPFHTLQRLSGGLDARYRAIIAAARAEPAAYTNIVSGLIQARDTASIVLTDDQLIGHLHTFATTNSDTSALGLTWTLFLLAQHPAILADLCDEIDGVLRGATPTADDLAQLPLLERVVKESLRILPPAAYLARRSNAPATLGGFHVPSNAWIIHSPYVTQHLPEVYADPARFYPDRWLGAAPPPYTYLPFGAGVHACIGATFALLTMRLALAMIVQRFSLQITPGARIDRQVHITLMPKYGMPMIIRPRNARIERSSVRGNIHEMVDLA